MYRAKRGQKRKRKAIRQKTRRQIGGFLNLYDFAQAGRDTFNQPAKIAPSIIKGPTNEISNIAQQRIDQIISQAGKEIERVLPEYSEELQGTFIKHHSDYWETLEKTIEQIKKQNFNIDVILFCFIYNQTIFIKIYIMENVDWFDYSNSSTHTYDQSQFLKIFLQKKFLRF